MSSIPLVILGGSDKKPSVLPPSGRDKHPLAGYKGIDIRVGGRYLIEEVVDRFRSTGAFDPIYIAGPAEIYRAARVRVPILDTDRSFSGNIIYSVGVVREENPPGPVAVTTCDILPEAAHLEVALEDYRRAAPCGIWFPMIEIYDDPSRLGAFAWKPSYRIRRRPDEDPSRYLPGHLSIFDPRALRFRFVNRLAQSGYRTRNRSITYRRWMMFSRVIVGLITQDLARLFTLRAPTVTWTIVGAGMGGAERLRQGLITVEELERGLTLIFMRNRHQREHPEQGARIGLLPGALSLAEDLDTLEEARARGATIAPESPAEGPKE